jgi:hypothetical protein
MTMSGWMLAKGRAGERVLTAVIPAGGKSIALAGADTIFALTQRLFISEADDSELQWLGRVTQVTSSAVSFSRTLKLAKSSGAKLWRAASVFDLPMDAPLPARRTTETGVVTQRSAGGEFYAIQVAEPRTTLRLVLNDLTPSSEDTLLAWLAEQTRWGLDPFTLLDSSGAPSVVRLAEGPIEQEREAGGRRRLTLPLTIVEEGAYQ